MNKFFKISQSGTNAPTTNNSNLTTTYNGNGSYKVGAVGYFANYDVAIFNNNNSLGIYIEKISDDEILIETYATNDFNTYSDNILTDNIVCLFAQETEYTPFELSKLAHAQSVLFGSGSEKLIALASSIGAPRPRP